LGSRVALTDRFRAPRKTAAGREHRLSAIRNRMTQSQKTPATVAFSSHPTSFLSETSGFAQTGGN